MIVSLKFIENILCEKSVKIKEAYERELLKQYYSLIPLLQYQFNMKDAYKLLLYTDYDADISFSVTAYKVCDNVFCLDNYFSDNAYELYFSSLNGIKINNEPINNAEKIMLVLYSK